MNKQMARMLIGCGLMAGGVASLAYGGNAGSWLIWLLILACPLLHLFMGYDHEQGKQAEGSEVNPESATNHLELTGGETRNE